MLKVAAQGWNLILGLSRGSKSRSARGRLAQGAALVALVALLGIGVLFKAYPGTLVWTVDHVRAVIGPVAIARLETEAFRLRSLIRRSRVGLGDTAPRWDLVEATEPRQMLASIKPDGQLEEGGIMATPTNEPVAITSPSPTLRRASESANVKGTNNPTVGLAPSATPTAQPTATPYPVTNASPTLGPTTSPFPSPTLATTTQLGWPPKTLIPVIPDGKLAQEGEWRPLHSLGDKGETLMMVTTFRPDTARPYIQVAIVAMDLTRTRLHLVPGVKEPPVPEPNGGTRNACIPDKVQVEDTLLAAFNGAFKYEHGQDGIGINGVTYIEPIWGRATLCIKPDGSLRIAAYGEYITDVEGLEAWRQNARLLVWEGAVTGLAREGGLRWGTTVDWQAETWRTGVGLSADGQTLYYVVGDGLTSLWLAEIFHTLECSAAMQLDINDYWVRFVTFGRDERGMLHNQPLISAMPREPQKYLETDQRDFFYLVRR